MGYAKTIAIFSMIAGVALPISGATPTEAYGEDMSQREVQALLMDRLQDVDPARIPGISARLMALCKRYDFPVSSILSLIAAESRFKVDAISPVGAIGLMQIMPGTALQIAERLDLRGYHGTEDLYDPKTNLTIGIAYLWSLRERYVQSHRYLAAYNLGPAKYNRFVRSQKAKPASVARYVRQVHNGVYEIRRSAEELVYAAVIESAGK